MANIYVYCKKELQRTGSCWKTSQSTLIDVLSKDYRRRLRQGTNDLSATTQTCVDGLYIGSLRSIGTWLSIIPQWPTGEIANFSGLPAIVHRWHRWPGAWTAQNNEISPSVGTGLLMTTQRLFEQTSQGCRWWLIVRNSDIQCINTPSGFKLSSNWF